MIELSKLTKARLDDVVVLSQKNRKPDEDPGAKLTFEIDAPGTLLAQWDARFPDLLWEPDPDAKQGQLKGMETDRLTNIGRNIGTLHWDKDQTGVRLEIDRGTGGRSNIIVTDCLMNAQRATLQEGRACKVKFTLESGNVSEADFGKLAKMKSTEISIVTSKPVVDQADIEDEDDDGSQAPPPKPAPTRKPAAAERAAVAKVKGGKAAPVQAVKYRDAATGSTWSGRGLQPAWIKAALAKGKKLSDFEAGAQRVPQGTDAWPFPIGARPSTEKPPQSVTIERSQPGTRTARGREATKAFINAHGSAKS